MANIQLFLVTPSGPIRLPIPANASNIHELFDDLPVGVYTSLCTFEHDKFLHLKDHLDRLQSSIAQLSLNYLLDRRLLLRTLQKVCSDYPLPNARVRLDVLARPAEQLDSDSQMLIGLSPFPPVPEHVYLDGVHVGVARSLIRKKPRIKKAQFVLERRRFTLEDPSVYEHLLLDADGFILEGTSSNFYAVRNGEIWTAGSGMLEGVARKIILEIADEMAIPVKLETVNINDISSLEEAAISSSSRGLVPIVRIDERVVGNGRPGPITQRVLKSYNMYVAKNIRPAIQKNDNAH
jgi:branched-chain amino acid aminotransferase